MVGALLLNVPYSTMICGTCLFFRTRIIELGKALLHHGVRQLLVGLKSELLGEPEGNPVWRILWFQGIVVFHPIFGGDLRVGVPLWSILPFSFLKIHTPHIHLKEITVWRAGGVWNKRREGSNQQMKIITCPTHTSSKSTRPSTRLHIGLSYSTAPG